MVLRSLAALSGLMVISGLFLSMTHVSIPAQDPEQMPEATQLAYKRQAIEDAKMNAIGATLVTIGVIGLAGAGLSALLRRSRQGD
jgi:mannose/fructose/N-acetylgalactosamine-specific phosphotransferase system component IID